jgi:D-beta-D-heptose 7-phosphate kinase / D-beta-D-heptose 1-phosphate adenosyltransferase
LAPVMNDIDQQLPRITDATVLCIGDLMLDDFIYRDVSRISPAAPAPVIAIKREETVIGGAGNVARGIAAVVLLDLVPGHSITGRVDRRPGKL